MAALIELSVRLLLLVEVLYLLPIAAFEIASRNYKIVLIPKNRNNPFFIPSHEGCVDAARHVGVTCLYEGPDEVNAQEQADILDGFIESGLVDGIALSVIDADILTPVIEKAVSHRIPIVTFDSDAPGSPRNAYIGTNNTFFGEQLGKVLKQLKPEGGTYGIVSTTDPNILERERGLRSSLQGNLWREISLSPSDMQGNATIGLEHMYEFAKFQPTAIMPVMGAPMRAAGYKKFVEDNRKITLVFADGMQNQLELLAANYAAGLVGQKPYEMGYFAIQVLYELIEGRQPETTFIGTNLLEHTNIPLVLPVLEVDANRIGDLRYVGFVLYGLIVAAALGVALWVFINRNVRVVTIAQPKFLIMVGLGISLLGSSIIPLSLDDSTGHDSTVICMSTPWFSTIGFTVTFSALFAKTRRVHRIFHTQKQVDSSEIKVAGPFLLILGANIVVLIAWTLIDPLTYERNNHAGTDGWNRIVSTYGSCRSENVIPFILPLALLNVGVLILGNYWAYQTRMITSEFSESKYIAIAMMSMLQAALTGIPLLFVVREHPEAYYLILIFMTFVISMVILVVIFVPKMVLALSLRNMDASEQKQLIQECVHISLSARQMSSNMTEPYQSQALSTASMRSQRTPPEALSSLSRPNEGQDIVINAECSYAKRCLLDRSAIQESMEREASRNDSKEFTSREFHTRELSSKEFHSRDPASNEFPSISMNFKSKESIVPEEAEVELSAFE